MGDRENKTPVLIAGGGMGGLAAAVALARHSIPSRILERGRTFAEAGAGIQLGPNVMRALGELDVTRHLAGQIVYPDAIRIVDGLDGRALASLPLGSAAERRYGAPYGVLHRADLQAGLLAAARACPEIAITTGFELSRYAEDDDGITAHSLAGDRARATMLIAADGISSRVRAGLAPGAKLQFFGRTAWRTLIDRNRAPALLGENEIGLWLGPEAHLIHYPVRGGASINVVAVIEDAWDKEGWNTAADPADLVPHFTPWCRQARDIVSAGTEWRKWALFALTPLTRWHGTRVVLLGDAAHPVLPFLAQGAGLAIEDALALAREIARGNGNDPLPAFDAYARRRRARASRVQAASRRMGAIYHLGGIPRRLRNLALAVAGPERHMARFDWLYRFEP